MTLGIGCVLVVAACGGGGGGQSSGGSGSSADCKAALAQIAATWKSVGEAARDSPFVTRDMLSDPGFDAPTLADGPRVDLTKVYTLYVGGAYDGHSITFGGGLALVIDPKATVAQVEQAVLRHAGEPISIVYRLPSPVPQSAKPPQMNERYADELAALAREAKLHCPAAATAHAALDHGENPRIVALAGVADQLTRCPCTTDLAPLAALPWFLMSDVYTTVPLLPKGTPDTVAWPATAAALAHGDDHTTFFSLAKPGAPVRLSLPPY